MIRVLWLCNFMLPAVAGKLGMEATNKEGWISGLASVVLKRQQDNDIHLSVAFPVGEEQDGCFDTLVMAEGGGLDYYGFYEDTAHPEQYDAGLEERLKKVVERANPDIVHCFGTEYPHTLAMCRIFPRRERILIGIQGLCAVCANAYMANLPEKIVKSATVRDRLRKDTLLMQQEKFVRRGVMEREAVGLAGNVTGRTPWDKHYASEWNPQAVYYPMNETLRSNFYEGVWREENAIPHSIFLSQGNYPLKGLHYMLLALPQIRKEYPDVKVYVAGDSLVKYDTWKDKLKISAYGKYLRSLIQEWQLQEQVVFLGSLTAQEMKERFLKSHLFVCCSSLENSPNSLGEAMLLGMPCVSADVGGVPGIFKDKEDGVLYHGYRTAANSFDNMRDVEDGKEETLDNIVNNLTAAVLEIWKNPEKMQIYCDNARNHAQKNHNREENYRNLTEVYANIANNINIVGSE